MNQKTMEEKSSSGKKFESPKNSNLFPLELFSSNFFFGSYGARCATEMADQSYLKLIPNHEEWYDKIA